MTETGVVHGRFQTLHNDHMKYLMAGPLIYWIDSKTDALPAQGNRSYSSVASRFLQG